jgi:hypothetical protein
LLLGVAALSAGSRPAYGERSLEIQQFHADVLVRRDGSMVVTERIRVRFNGSWNGIYRSIPVNYAAPGGFNYKLRLDIRHAKDAAGQLLRVEEERAGRYLRVRIYVPAAENATREVLLTYEVRNGLRFFAEHDELYWNVTGEEWDFPIGSATAQVLLPAEVDGVRTASFTGAYGATETSAHTEQIGNAVHVRATRPLGARD